jgi:hypothetical protein
MSYIEMLTRADGYVVPADEYNKIVGDLIALRAAEIAIASQVSGSIPHASSASQLAVTSGFTFDGTTLAIPNGLKERGRSTAAGEWVSVAFNAANFTASAGNWTLVSGDQATFAYTLIGKTMTVSFVLNTTTVSATPASVRIAIPGGFTSAKVEAGMCRVNDNGTERIALVTTSAAGSLLTITLTAAGVNFSSSTDNTSVQGQLTFEVS